MKNLAQLYIIEFSYETCEYFFFKNEVEVEEEEETRIEGSTIPQSGLQIRLPSKKKNAFLLNSYIKVWKTREREREL